MIPRGAPATEASADLLVALIFPMLLALQPVAAHAAPRGPTGAAPTRRAFSPMRPSVAKPGLTTRDLATVTLPATPALFTPSRCLRSELRSDGDRSPWLRAESALFVRRGDVRVQHIVVGSNPR